MITPSEGVTSFVNIKAGDPVRFGLYVNYTNGTNITSVTSVRLRYACITYTPPQIA